MIDKLLTDADMVYRYAKTKQAEWDRAHQPAENPDWPMGEAMIAGNPYDDMVQHPERYVSDPSLIPKEKGL